MRTGFIDVHGLTATDQEKVADFAKFLKSRHSEGVKTSARNSKVKKHFHFKWAGALKDLKKKHSSVSLQKEIASELFGK